MRVVTALNLILRVSGARVVDVEVDQGVLVVKLKPTARLHRCPSGATTAARYDRSRRRWRHLNFAMAMVFYEADIARVDCRGCGRVRTEAVPWARPGARHTILFEALVPWLAQPTDKTSISRLLRCSWEAIQRVVTRLTRRAPPATPVPVGPVPGCEPPRPVSSRAQLWSVRRAHQAGAKPR